MPHEAKQPRIDGVEIVPSNTEKGLVIRKQDAGQANPENDRAGDQHAQAE